MEFAMTDNITNNYRNASAAAFVPGLALTALPRPAHDSAPRQHAYTQTHDFVIHTPS
jgi:hypothetical protein